MSLPAPMIFVSRSTAASQVLRGGRRVYRLNDLVHSVSLGIVQQLVGLWTKALGLVVYLHIWRHHRLVELPHEDWRVWLVLALGCDCGYYWFHRTAHTFHFMWAAHAVHHSGED